MSRSLACLALALAGCTNTPEHVRLTASIRADVAEASGPFADATVNVLDESGARYGEAVTGADGELVTRVPPSAVFHLVIDGADHVPASFSGQSGVSDRFKVEDGLLHGVTTAEFATWTDRFAGCPGVGEPGGAVIAEPRVAELVDDDGVHPTVNAAVAEIWDPRSGEVIATACYLDDAGEAWDPDATLTGESGLFAIFGVPEGEWVLSVGLEVLPGSYTWDDTVIYLTDGGVAPRFPAWVHFPLR